MWTDAGGVWSYDDEKWFMRRLIHNYSTKQTKIKKRDISIVRKYYTGEALCYAGIRAKNETTYHSGNPYRISLQVHGLPDKHISFTVKSVKVNSPGGNDLSDAANKGLPATIELKNESSTSDKLLVWGYYDSQEVFNFKNEPVILEYTVEINSVDGSETGTVAFELKPVVKFGLFRSMF